MSLMRRSEEYPAWPNFLNDFFGRDWMDWSNRHFSETHTTLPAVNIKEDQDGYIVEMAAPGLEKKDFSIVLEHGVLTISSVKKVEDGTQDGKQFSRHEFSYQSFSRSFTLPETVEGEKISARYQNGILLVSIPKKEEAKPKPPKTIEIK
jgi:HSP20 family protein